MEGYKIPVILMVALIAIIVIFPFLSDIFQSIGTEPEIDYTLHPLEKTEIDTETCLATFTGEVHIDYERELKEIEIQARIEEKPRGMQQETYTATRTIEDPGENFEFEIDVEAPQKCDNLINPELEILSIKRKLL